MTQRDRSRVASMLFHQRTQGVSGVIIIRTTNLTAYLHEIDTLRTQYQGAGLPITIRVSRAVYAGSEAGSVAVVVDMPDYATLSKLNDLQKSNAGIAGCSLSRLRSCDNAACRP
jgi:hypothetical protein